MYKSTRGLKVVGYIMWELRAAKLSMKLEILSVKLNWSLLGVQKDVKLWLELSGISGLLKIWLWWVAANVSN